MPVPDDAPEIDPRIETRSFSVPTLRPRTSFVDRLVSPGSRRGFARVARVARTRDVGPTLRRSAAGLQDPEA
jgi:hypothetical protein